MGSPSLIRRIWARLWLRRAQFSGDYRRLKALYAVEDPWELGSAREQQRFARTNEIIREIAPNCRSLLEVGCGEGYQTQKLSEVSASIVGIEVSAQAVERAQRRCPGARFLAGRAEDAAQLVGEERFDIVTAFEVLYYAKEISPIVASLQKLAPVLLVTNYLPRSEHMAASFTGPGWTRLDDLSVGETVWRVDVWRKPA
jgi:2-polyprenyl-3-methyl-5-hydroxy-6-metoxy-1,4-benzoquinol methylase